AGDLLLGLLGHGREALGLHRLLLLGLLGRQRQRRLAGLAEACGEFRQVTPFAEEPAARVHHLDVHAQMRLDLLGGFQPGLVRRSSAGPSRPRARSPWPPPASAARPSGSAAPAPPGWPR